MARQTVVRPTSVFGHASHHPLTACLVVSLLSSCAPLIHAEPIASAADAGGSYVAHEAIIKVDGPTMAAIDASLDAGTFPKIGIGPLDAALAAAGAIAARVVIRESPEDYEALKAKYPDRAQRIPPGAQPPEPSTTYLLTLAPGASVDAAIQALSGLPGVAYAQPNYVASTQAGAAQP